MASGAVKRLNSIRTQVQEPGFAPAPGFHVNGLKREELIATNSMLLHGLYFQCLGGSGQLTVPAMALDMYEHAHRMEFGANAAAYVDTFIALINWGAVCKACQLAVHAASEAFAAAQGDADGAVVVDVRRVGMYEQAKTIIPGASWRDPANTDAWAGALARDHEVIVYCIYGQEVGRRTAMRLHAQGLNARALAGGMDGWHAAGRPLAEKPKG